MTILSRNPLRLKHLRQLEAAGLVVTRRGREKLHFETGERLTTPGSLRSADTAARLRMLLQRAESDEQGGSVYATMTTTHGATTEDNAAVAEMVGETMVEWLRDIEGFGGLLMLNNADTGVTQVIALWESEELAERHHEARMRLRDRVTATVEVEVVETVPYQVTFAHLRSMRLAESYADVGE